MTTKLTCLQLHYNTEFVDDNNRRVTDSGLTVADMSPLWKNVVLYQYENEDMYRHMYDERGGEVLEEFCVENQRFVFKS